MGKKTYPSYKRKLCLSWTIACLSTEQKVRHATTTTGTTVMLPQRQMANCKMARKVKCMKTNWEWNLHPHRDKQVAEELLTEVSGRCFVQRMSQFWPWLNSCSVLCLLIRWSLPSDVHPSGPHQCCCPLQLHKVSIQLLPQGSVFWPCITPLTIVYYPLDHRVSPLRPLCITP